MLFTLPTVSQYRAAGPPARSYGRETGSSDAMTFPPCHAHSSVANNPARQPVLRCIANLLEADPVGTIAPQCRRYASPTSDRFTLEGSRGVLAWVLVGHSSGRCGLLSCILRSIISPWFCHNRRCVVGVRWRSPCRAPLSSN